MHIRFDRLAAAALLSLLVAVPALTEARPRVESAEPPPPALNSQHDIRQRTTAPVQDAAPQPVAPSSAMPKKTEGGAFERAFGTAAASDAEIAERLRAIVSAPQFDRLVERVLERKAIRDYYAAHDYAPIWVYHGRLTARAKSAIARLKDAASEGLVAADYPAPDGRAGSADALARADLELTHSLITFARHLQSGRIAPRRVFAQVQYPEHDPDPAQILKTLAQARTIETALDSFDPPHAGFRALKAKLAELRANAAASEPPDRIPGGKRIKPGAKDPRIPALRARLHVRGDADSTTYDRALYRAVRALQYRHGLHANGVIDAKTIAILNGRTPDQVIATVEANMERWRWLPRDLGDTYVMVNIPDFSLKVVHDERTVWRTKIVAGKPQTPTPLLTAAMDNVIVNPSWYVPQSIIENELLPQYRSDPNIFDRLGLEVQRGADGHINVVQPPGAANALGRIKFNFPNKFQVYLHDTPQKRLFKYDRRAFSHGCMRVQDPTRFGEVMLHLAMNGPTPSERQLDSLFGRGEKTFRLARRPMVHLTYQTAFVDEAGKLDLRDDLYGFDARIRAIMHSRERRIADLSPPPDPKRDLGSVQSSQDILRRVERREALNPLHFFEKLFR